MSDLNALSVTGRVTQDAQYKTLASGKGLLTVNIANNIGYGDYQKTNWIKVQQWGEKGQNVAQYLTKGTLIACSGELSTNEWTSRDGEKKTDLVLTTNSIQILARPKTDQQQSSEPLDYGNGDIPF